MPPDGDGDLNVIVRVGKVKGELECCADRTVSTGGYTDLPIDITSMSNFDDNNNEDVVL